MYAALQIKKSHITAKGVNGRCRDDDYCLRDRLGITKTTRPLRKTFDV